MRKITLFMTVTAVLASLCGCKRQQPAANEESASSAEAVMANILQRKSVRAYTSDSIPGNVMENLLRAAMAAPSGMNVQPWSFVVINDKSRLEEIFGDNMNMRMFKQAAAIVVLCADTTFCRPPRENPEGEAVTQANRIWRDDMGAVTENLLLAAEAHGLGACWTACYPFEERMAPVKEALQLPETVVPYSIVPIGYPANEEQPKDKWDPKRIHYNHW